MQHYDLTTAKQKSPKDFLGLHRLDLACKFLYIKNFIESNNDNTIQLYKDHIYYRTGGIEPRDRFLPDQNLKKSTDDYVASFNSLIINFKTYGYNNSFPIFYSKKGIINGAHRIACALYFNTQVPCIEVNKNGKGIWDRKWFEKYKFPESNIILLENTVRKLMNEQL